MVIANCFEFKILKFIKFLEVNCKDKKIELTFM